MYIHVKDASSNTLSEGTGLAPLMVGPLNASINESSAAIQLTVYCDAGFKTYGDTVISFSGTSAAKWTICSTADGTYGSSLTISSEIAAAGTAFYVKAVTTDDETPANDTSTKIAISATIQAA